MRDSEMHTLGYVLFFLWNRALQTCKKPEKTSRLEVSKSDILGEKVLPSYNTWFVLVYKASQPRFPGWTWGNAGHVLKLDLSFALAAGPLRPAKALQRLVYALVIFVLSRSLLPCPSVWGGWAQWPLLPSSSGQISQWCAPTGIQTKPEEAVQTPGLLPAGHVWATSLHRRRFPPVQLARAGSSSSSY